MNLQLPHLGGARSDHPRGVYRFAFSGNKGIAQKRGILTITVTYCKEYNSL